MRLCDYLDKGAMLGADAPSLTMGESDLSYAQTQRLTYRIGQALHRSGLKSGAKAAAFSGDDATAFA